MAKDTIIHTCGHTATHQLYGPLSERERRAEWLATTVCSECYHAEQKAEREAQNAAQNAAAAASNASVGLPALIGSEKQIAWAETIRAEKISELETAIAGFPNREKAVALGKEEDFDRQLGRCRKTLRVLRSTTQASWWIDHRDRSARELVIEIAK